MRFYGKDRLIGLLTDTAAENRLPHAIMLCGEKGSGRMTVAEYIAALFLCGVPPCGGCNQCRRIYNGTHPDVIRVYKECGDKYSLTSVKGQRDIREFMEGTAIKPNDGDIKVYIFENADEMSVPVQNTLLKNIEEPQPWVKYIFICENPGSLLETIRSRVTEYTVPDCSPMECKECLVNEYGIDPKKADELSQQMSGNIGKCLDALKTPENTKKSSKNEEDFVPVEQRLMDSAVHAAKGIAFQNGYIVCTALGEQTGRKEFSGMLLYLSGILRDALAVRTGGELYSCGKAEAKTIAENFDEIKITAMIESVFEVNEKANTANLNLALCAAYLTSRLL